MYRQALKQLKNWKNSGSRMPLVVKGARQVGKTWLIKHFGEENYDNMVYINFDREQDAKNIFALDYAPDRLISRLGAHAHQEIVPGKTLIFLDEIQECPEALESLKYFTEEKPDYHIIVAGSLLGLYLHEGASFPVGKVDFLDIYPLNFREFLVALGEDQLASAIEKHDQDLLKPFHDKLVDYYKTYLTVGGMPAVVREFVETRSFLKARDVQERIVDAYNRDFSKHAPASEVPRIIEIFNIIPHTLAKENKKFMFGAIKQSARMREYEAALLWLINAGIVSKVNMVNKIALPLPAYANHDAFKLFYVDVGLLGYKSELRPEVIMEDNPFLEEFKGALAEQFVFQEMVASGVQPYYYSKDDSRAELDFLIDTKNGPAPIEVKSGKALASKSFTAIMRDNPKVVRGYKLSLLPYAENERVVNLPIYEAGELDSI